MLSQKWSKTCEFSAKLCAMKVTGSLRFSGPHPDMGVLRIIFQVETFCNNCFYNFSPIQKNMIFITVCYATHSDFIHSLIFSLVAFVIALPYKARPREDTHTCHFHVCPTKSQC